MEHKIETGKRKMKPLWKWVIGLTLGLIILVIGTAFYFTSKWEPILETQLKEVVHDSSDGLYQISYDDVNLNILSGNATFKGLKLNTDSNIYNQQISEERADNELFEVDIDELRIRGLNIKNILLDKLLSVKTITIKNADVHLTQHHFVFNDSLISQNDVKLYQTLEKTFKKVQAEFINLNNVDFHLTQYKDSVNAVKTDIPGIQLTIKNLVLDSASYFDVNRLYYTEAIDLKLPKFHKKLADSINYIQFDSLYFNSQNRELKIKGFVIEPYISRSEYYKRMGFAKDMTKTSIGWMHFSGFNANALIEEKKLRSTYLTLEDGKLDVSNNLHYPRSTKSKNGHAPHQKLLRLPLNFKIDTVQVQNVDIRYAELSGKYNKEGEITFDRANGIITHVTNDSLTLSEENWMHADLTAYMMNTGKLHAIFGFDMTAENGAFTCEGTLGPMDGRVINRIVTPLLNIEVESANIKGIKFKIQGHDYRNWGTLNFDYDNLKVNLVSTEEEGDRSKKGIVSFVANQFLVNTSNPDSKGNYLIGPINYTRIPEHSFFKNLWQSLFDGVKHSVGVNKEKEKKITNVVNFFKNPFGSNKE